MSTAFVCYDFPIARSLTFLLGGTRSIHLRQGHPSTGLPWRPKPGKPSISSKSIRSWHGEEARDGGKKLRVVYFHPKDREPIKDHRKRWDGIMSDMRDFYRVEMKRLGIRKGRPGP